MCVPLCLHLSILSMSFKALCGHKKYLVYFLYISSIYFLFLLLCFLITFFKGFKSYTKTCILDPSAPSSGSQFLTVQDEVLNVLTSFHLAFTAHTSTTCQNLPGIALPWQCCIPFIFWFLFIIKFCIHSSVLKIMNQ